MITILATIMLLYMSYYISSYWPLETRKDKNNISTHSDMYGGSSHHNGAREVQEEK